MKRDRKSTARVLVSRVEYRGERRKAPARERRWKGCLDVVEGGGIGIGLPARLGKLGKLRLEVRGGATAVAQPAFWFVDF